MVNQPVGETRQESIDVKEYLYILLKRKWLILLCFLLSMSVTLAYLYTRQEIYRANLKLLNTYPGRQLPSADIQRESTGTEYSIMRSQMMLRRVQQRMKKTPAEFREGLSDVGVTSVRGTDIVMLTADSPSREFAKEFANVLADEYLRYREEQRSQVSEQALLSLTREINRLSQEMKAAHQRMLDFAREKSIPVIDMGGGLQQSRLLSALAQRSQAEADLEAAKMRKRTLDASRDPATVLAVLESSKQSDSPNLATSANTTTDAEWLRQPLIAGARVAIDVAGRSDLTAEFTVSVDGDLDLPVVGKISVSGQTPASAEKNIQELLAKAVSNTAKVKVLPPAPAIGTPQPDVTTTGGNQVASTTNAAPGSAEAAAIMRMTERSEALFRLENRRQALTAQLEELRKAYKPRHPALVKLEMELQNVTNEIQLSIEFIRRRADADVQLAQEKLAYVRSTTADIDSQMMSSYLRGMEMTGLRDEYKRIEGLHDSLLSSLMKIDMTQGFSSRNVSILEPAITEDLPIYPKKTKWLVVAAFGGLGLGLAIAFFIEYIDDSIKLAEEVERDLQLSFLGMIPAAQWNPDDLTEHRLDRIKQQGGIAEAYRVVRSAILFSVPREKLRSVLVTSAVPREGKTTTGVNMAIGFSQIEDRVLLVDGDLRRGEIHKYFGLARDKGLTDILLGQATPEEAVKHTDVPKLDLITTGDYPTNPAELLLGWRLKEFLDWAYKHYNRVVFDGPPVMGIADSAILGAAVDGVMLIIWAGRTSRRYVRVAKMTAVSRGAKIFGFILNNLEPGRVGYYHYYPYYYSYYYRGYYHGAPGEAAPTREKAKELVPTMTRVDSSPSVKPAASAPPPPAEQPPVPPDDIEDVY